MLKGNVDGAVAVLDVEYHRVAAGFLPAPDELNTFGASRSQPREVDSPHLSVLWERPAFLNYRLRLDPRNQGRFALPESALAVIGLLDGVFELGRGHIGGAGEMQASQK